MDTVPGMIAILFAFLLAALVAALIFRRDFRDAVLGGPGEATILKFPPSRVLQSCSSVAYLSVEFSLL